jgi:hypothetical protein
MKKSILKIVLLNFTLLLSMSVIAQQKNKKVNSENVQANIQTRENSKVVVNQSEVFNLKARLEMKENIDILTYKVKLMDKKMSLVDCKMILMVDYMNKSFKMPKDKKTLKENIVSIEEAIKNIESDIVLANELMVKEN